jgi:hypothetical protein
MALYIEAGFDIDGAINGLGTVSLNLTEAAGGGAQAATISTGRFCHTDLTPVLGSGEYDDFAGALKAVLDAASANGQTYTVTWSTAAQTYTISAAGAFTLAFSGAAGIRMRRILGFTADTSSATSQVSDMVPYYTFAATYGIFGKSGPYESGDAAFDDEGDDGSHDGIARETVATYEEFTVGPEPHDKMVQRRATEGAGDVSWALQSLFRHARVQEPLYTVDEGAGENTVRFLRASGAHFAPSRDEDGSDDFWSVVFETRVVGRI